MLRYLGAGALALALAGQVVAHGDLQVQIEAVSALIARNSGSAELYLKRADLRRIHEEWNAALSDYRAAERLSPSLIGIALGRGQLWLAREDYSKARHELDKVIVAVPNHVEALVSRARALVGLRKGQAAAADFSRAIAVAQQPEPEWYLERAQALSSLDKPSWDDALAGLDEGLQRFGLLPTLGLYAVELEQARGHLDAALARLEQLRANASRQETWWERIGDVQARAGRSAQAQEAYVKARQACSELPARLRETASVHALELRLVEKLAAITPPD